MRKLLLVTLGLALLLVPLFQVSAQDAGGAGLALTVGPAPIYVYSYGGQYIPSGGAILFCSAVHVSGSQGGFAKLSEQGGWIPVTSFIYVSELSSVAQRFSACAANAHG